jgi:hypothetical protein
VKFQGDSRSLLPLKILVVFDDSLVGIDTGFDVAGHGFFLVEGLINVVDRTLVVDHRNRRIREMWPQAVWVAWHDEPFASWA